MCQALALYGLFLQLSNRHLRKFSCACLQETITVGLIDCGHFLLELCREGHRTLPWVSNHSFQPLVCSSALIACGLWVSRADRAVGKGRLREHGSITTAMQESSSMLCTVLLECHFGAPHAFVYNPSPTALYVSLMNSLALQWDCFYWNH